MSNREKCHAIIDSISDEQLADIAVILEKAIAEETADDAFCLQLYADYLASPDKGEAVPLEEFAKILGVDLCQ